MTKRFKLVLFAVVLSTVALFAAQTLVDLGHDVSGVLPLVNGGTGTTTGDVPSGMIGFINTGSCPSGWTQQAYSGDYLLMTVAANADAGTTGGSTSYTPAGTVSTPTMSATGTKFTTSSSGTAALTAMSGTTIASGANTVTLPARTFAGNAATIQPPFVKLIACQKN